MADVDVGPMLNTLSKLTNGRIVQGYSEEKIGEVTRVFVPVRFIDPDDRVDKISRRYIRDWVKRNVKNVSVEARLKKAEAGTCFHTEEEAISIAAIIEVTWWPRPADGEEED